MQLPVLPFVLFTFCLSEAITTVAYKGTMTTITCPLQGQYTLPVWKGPPGPIIYTQEGKPDFNPHLGKEKLSRLEYAINQRDLSLIDVRIIDNGTYECIINNGVIAATNDLVVRVRPDQPEIMSSVLDDNNVIRATEGQMLTVTCTSRGGYPVPTLAWYKGSTAGQQLVKTSTWTQVNDPSDVTLPYTFTPTRQDDRQQLVCRSYWPTPADAHGSLAVLLYLNLKPFQPSVIQTASVVAGNEVTVECRASGSRPASAISWTYKDQTYTPTATTTNDTATQTSTTVSVLRRPVTPADNNKTVVCRVSNVALDYELNVSAPLNVQFPVRPATTKINGNRVIVANGINKLALVCTTGSSNPPADITWRNGTNAILNNNVYTNTMGENNGVVRAQTLQFTPTRYDHGGSISCFATNGVNQFTDDTTVTLSFNFTPIVTISTTSSITLIEQSSQSPTVLTCSADSNPRATISWNHNGMAATDENEDTSTLYTIREASRTSYGNYTCAANNGVPPGDSKTYTVNILFRPLEVNIEKSTGIIIANGQNHMSISCTSGTSNPVSEIKWITGNIKTSTPSQLDSPGACGGAVRTSTISFNPTRDHDGTTVRCEARNNVTGQNEVSNSTAIDNINYPPLIADIPARTVTEGDSVTLACHASSKPPASFTWKRDSYLVNNGQGTALYNGLNYTIHNTSRTKAGMYLCTANNQVQPSDFKQILLTVLYPPDVTVIAINKTANSNGTTVTCEASGVPAQYTYTRWVHTWNGHVVNHPESLPAMRVLTLTNLSYAHSGVYMCGASNGVKGISYGAGSLLVKSPPIVLGDLINGGAITVSGKLMKAITVTFQYYSNAGKSSVTVQKTNGTGEDVGGAQLKDVNVSLSVFLSEISVPGTEATINITVTNMNQFGCYDVFVKNEVNSVQLSLIIKPIGPPEPPVLVSSTTFDHQSVSIVWISGFPNGLNQTFVIQLSTDNSTWRNITQYGGMTYQQTHSKTIYTLASNQLYYVRMLARNAEGESDHTGVFSFKTAVAPPTSQDSSSGSLTSWAVAGGLVGALVVAVAVGTFVWKRKCSPGGNYCGHSIRQGVDISGPKGNNNVDQTMTSVRTTESLESQPYETLNVARDTQCYDQLHANRTNSTQHVYENSSAPIYKSLQKGREIVAKPYDQPQLGVPEQQTTVYENLKLTAL